MSKIEFDYTIAPKRKMGTRATATITSIKEVKAVDVFKTAAENPDQLLYVIDGKIDDWTGRIGIINKPTSKEISAKSNLAKFMQRYEKYPEIGMQVDVIANDAGYWKLDV